MTDSYEAIYITIFEEQYAREFLEVIKHIKSKIIKSTIIIRILEHNGDYQDVVFDKKNKMVS